MFCSSFLILRFLHRIGNKLKNHILSPLWLILIISIYYFYSMDNKKYLVLFQNL